MHWSKLWVHHVVKRLRTKFCSPVISFELFVKTMARRSKRDVALRNKLVALHSAGKSIRAICQELSCSKGLVQRTCISPFL